MCFFFFKKLFAKIGHEIIIKFSKFYARMVVNAANNHIFMFRVDYFNEKLTLVPYLKKILSSFFNLYIRSSFMYKSAPPFSPSAGQCSIL